MRNDHGIERNRGCLIGAFFAGPLIAAIIFGWGLGGGGCEGAPQPCTPNYGGFWLYIVVVVGLGLAIARITNRTIRVFEARGIAARRGVLLGIALAGAMFLLLWLALGWYVELSR